MARIPASIRFRGGRVCLDFLNTVDRLRTERPWQWLEDYALLLEWSEGRGCISGQVRSSLARVAAAHPAKARAIFEKACAFRNETRAVLLDSRSFGEAIRRFRAASGIIGLIPDQPALVSDASGTVARYDLPGRDLSEPLWPIYWSFSSMLTEENPVRISQCRADGCGYVFLDTSRQRSRIWCSDECGNRMRVAKHALKHANPS